jgi:hypothetical protein
MAPPQAAAPRSFGGRWTVSPIPLNTAERGPRLRRVLLLPNEPPCSAGRRPQHVFWFRGSLSLKLWTALIQYGVGNALRQLVKPRSHPS